MSATSVDAAVPGGRLIAYHLGQGAGTPVLAAHGITGNSHSWLAVARALEGRRALLAVDLRGRGASRDLPGPFGLDAHVRDLVALLDAQDINRTVCIGHSMGAYIVSRLAVQHPDRVSGLVLVDGGLRIPGSQVDDPQAFLEAFLGITLSRLSLQFASQEEYLGWWHAHPAFVGNEVDEAILSAYTAHDLTGTAPQLHSGVSEQAVREDGADVILGQEDARRLAVPATLLCAPLGLRGEPSPMQPLEVAEAWAAEDPERRTVQLVPDVNHYTITLGTRGAEAVAAAVREAVA